MNPLFLTYDEVLEIHADQIAHYGGANGIRDEGLLHSALHQPMATFGDDLLHPTIESQAAAYLFHLVKNHPFIDGNKRVGAATCLVFLDINGFELDQKLDDVKIETGQTGFEEVVLAVATGIMSKEDLTNFLCQHTYKI